MNTTTKKPMDIEEIQTKLAEVKMILNDETEFFSRLMNEIDDLQNDYNLLLEKLCELLSFGTQKGKIEEIKKSLEAKRHLLGEKMELRDIKLKNIEFLGNERQTLIVLEKEYKDYDIQMKDQLVNSIGNYQKKMHEAYNQLEQIKLLLTQGYNLKEIEGMVGNVEFKIGNLVPGGLMN